MSEGKSVDQPQPQPVDWGDDIDYNDWSRYHPDESPKSDKSAVILSDELAGEHEVVVGDVVKIESKDPKLAGIWWIEYISPDKIIVVNKDKTETDTFVVEDGVIKDDRIDTIMIRKTDKMPNGYAEYRNFVPDMWVEIVFDGLDFPIIGKINSIVNDVIEIIIFEDGLLLTDDPIMIDFNYTGLPEGVMYVDSIDSPEDIEEKEGATEREATELGATELGATELGATELEGDYIVGNMLDFQILEERD